MFADTARLNLNLDNLKNIKKDLDNHEEREEATDVVDGDSRKYIFSFVG